MDISDLIGEIQDQILCVTPEQFCALYEQKVVYDPRTGQKPVDIYAVHVTGTRFDGVAVDGVPYDRYAYYDRRDLLIDYSRLALIDWEAHFPITRNIADKGLILHECSLSLGELENYAHGRFDNLDDLIDFISAYSPDINWAHDFLDSGYEFREFFEFWFDENGFAEKQGINPGIVMEFFAVENELFHGLPTGRNSLFVNFPRITREFINDNHNFCRFNDDANIITYAFRRKSTRIYAECGAAPQNLCQHTIGRCNGACEEDQTYCSVCTKKKSEEAGSVSQG